MLDKYRKIIGGLLNCKPKEIKFFITKIVNNKKIEHEVSELKYTKKSNEWSLGDYKIMVNGELISSFKLYEMPHCCAIMVSCKAFVNPYFRNKRVGTILNNLRQDIGRLLNYSTILCTDVEKNTHQRQLLKTNGWKDIHDVINKRTKNRVFISVLNL